ncbi:hypothetical protein [Streptomyces sp. YIM 98790]|uniref:hypothetical protein n=1 Tax=Streptomyces sp. YIM 98790 TaxID=2689077 RepID=UPI001FB575BD|nr:hypothetical protein [Streptomyces sp. YIM 98790]
MDVSLWTHDPGYVTTYEEAVRDRTLMRGGSRFDYRMRITSAAPADIVTRMTAQAIAEGNTPDLAGIVIDQYPRVMGYGIAENLFVDLSETVRPLGGGLLKLAPLHRGRDIVVSSPGDYTLPLGIQALFGATGRPYDLVLAGAVLAAVPSLLVFFLLRKHLVEGLTAGAVKS